MGWFGSPASAFSRARRSSANAFLSRYSSDWSRWNCAAIRLRARCSCCSSRSRHCRALFRSPTESGRGSRGGFPAAPPGRKSPRRSSGRSRCNCASAADHVFRGERLADGDREIAQRFAAGPLQGGDRVRLARRGFVGRELRQRERGLRVRGAPDVAHLHEADVALELRARPVEMVALRPVAHESIRGEVAHPRVVVGDRAAGRPSATRSCRSAPRDLPARR